MIDMSDSCANLNIEANPDIAGIGIRISFYITTILGALIPRIHKTAPLQAALTTAAGLNGVALLITAIVQTASNQLDLYHALVILHMLAFLGVTTNPTGNYKAASFRMVLIAITTWCALGGFISWAIYVLATAPTFGSQNGCNHEIVYVVMFRNVRATVGWLRWILVVGLSVGAFLLTVVPVAALVYYVIAYRYQDPNDHDEIPSPKLIGYLMGNMNTDTRTALARVLAAVYATVMLELTVQRNDHIVASGENQWGFGQFVALLVALGGVNEVIHFILSPPHRHPQIDDEEHDRPWLQQVFSRRQSSSTPTETPGNTPDDSKQPGNGFESGLPY